MSWTLKTKTRDDRKQTIESKRMKRKNSTCKERSTRRDSPTGKTKTKNRSVVFWCSVSLVRGVKSDRQTRRGKKCVRTTTLRQNRKEQEYEHRLWRERKKPFHVDNELRTGVTFTTPHWSPLMILVVDDDDDWFVPSSCSDWTRRDSRSGTSSSSDSEIETFERKIRTVLETRSNIVSVFRSIPSLTVRSGRIATACELIVHGRRCSSIRRVRAETIGEFRWNRGWKKWMICIVSRSRASNSLWQAEEKEKDGSARRQSLKCLDELDWLSSSEMSARTGNAAHQASYRKTHAHADARILHCCYLFERELEREGENLLNFSPTLVHTYQHDWIDRSLAGRFDVWHWWTFSTRKKERISMRSSSLLDRERRARACLSSQLNVFIWLLAGWAELEVNYRLLLHSDVLPFHWQGCYSIIQVNLTFSSKEESIQLTSRNLSAAARRKKIDRFV